MTLTEVSDGGLQIDLEAGDPILQFGGAGKDGLKWCEKYFGNAYQHAGDNAKVIWSIKHALQGQERFFLPVQSSPFY